MHVVFLSLASLTETLITCYKLLLYSHVAFSISHVPLCIYKNNIEIIIVMCVIGAKTEFITWVKGCTVAFSFDLQHNRV